MLTLLGPSGCGKTTTLRMIAGLEEPDGGTIRAGSRMVYDAANRIDIPSGKSWIRDGISVLRNLAHMSVLENVAYPLKVRHVPKAKRIELVRRVLDLVGLSGLEDRAATRLSGGQQQRVGFRTSLSLRTGNAAS